MKKIALTVPKPCRENWDAMTPDAHGRFCGSCQKSVVDFSSMSDRQIAEFFKKPLGSVCGRFHNDQLNREVEIPKKRLPWLRYFFTIALPAFLASCKGGTRQALQGKVLAEKVEMTRTIGDTVIVPSPIVGLVLAETEEIDSVPKKKPAVCKQKPETSYTVGELMPPPVKTEDVDSVAILVIEPVKETSPMDTVTVVSYGTKTCSTVMGEPSIVRTKRKVPEESVQPGTTKEAFNATAYPNPVQAGNAITVLFQTDVKPPVRFQLFSSTGALVTLPQNPSGKGKTFSLLLPSMLAAGTYFLRAISGDAPVQTVKIIVVN